MTDDLPQIHVGDHVKDREDDDAATMLVISTSLLTAEKVEVKGDQTVHDFNPEYPADDPVVEVVYAGRDERTLRTDGYNFPRSRLKRVAAIHDVDRLNGADENADGDGEGQDQ